MNFGPNVSFGFGSSGGGGGGGGFTTANNGLTSTGTTVQWGQTISQGGDPGALLHGSEIPFAGFSMQFIDRGTGNYVLFDPTSVLGSVQVLNNKVNHIITGSNADGFFAYWTPSNYLTTYTGGNPNPQTANRFYTGYGLFANVNADGRPNVVGIPWAYNATVGGGRAVTTDAGFQFRTETHFIINGLANTPAHFEFHLPEMTTYGGTAFRLWSIYADKATADAFIQSCNTSTIFFDNTAGGAPDFPHLGFSKSNGGGAINLASYNPTDVTQVTFSNTTHGNVLLKYDTGTFFIQAQTNKNWSIQGQDVSAAFRRWDWGTTQVGGTGWSVVFGQVAVFAGSEAVVQIYSTGNTASSQTFQTRRTGITGKSFTIWDDGSVMACGSNTNGDGQFTIGVVGNTGAIDPSAKLQVNSSTLGYLGPGGTSTNRLAIGSTADGLNFYDNTIHLPFFYNGTSWLPAGTSSVAGTDLTAQTGSVASVATFTPGAAGTFRVGAYVAITAISAGTVTITVTWTDENSTSRTTTLFPQGLTAAGLTATGFTAFPTVDIRSKTGTPITVVATFAGVSVTYDVGGTIQMLR